MDLIEEVISALRRIIRAIDVHSKTLAQFEGLTVPQLLVLKELSGNGAMTVGELAKRMNLSGATVTSILDRMEKRDMVQRTRADDDKRRVMVKILPKGGILTKSAPPLLQEKFIEKFRLLQDWEQTRLLSAIQQIASMMDIKELEIENLMTNESLDASAAKMKK